MQAILLLLLIHWYSSLFFQSVFHHRYAAHTMFTMSKGWEKVFYICCFITQGASYISAYAYGIMHRLHHAYTDTEKDPHSPKNDPNLFALMWKTRNKYYSIYSGKTMVEEKFRKNLPRWDFVDKIAHTWVARFLWIGSYTLYYIHFATEWWMYLFLPIHFSMAAFQGASVNWWAHRFGYVNFKVNNTSKNIIPIDLIFLGEAYHNNHHKYPTKPKTSYRWFEFDPAYIVMKLLHKVKIIQLKNVE